LQPVLNGQVAKDFFSLLANEDVVELLEGLLEGFGVVSLFEGFVGLQRKRELLGAELRNLHPSVAVENAEKEGFFADPVEEDGVLHVLSPS